MVDATRGEAPIAILFIRSRRRPPHGDRNRSDGRAPSMARLASRETMEADRGRVQFKVPNSKKIFRHLHGDLNLDEIKNVLYSLYVNRETNLINLIKS